MRITEILLKRQKIIDCINKVYKIQFISDGSENQNNPTNPLNPVDANNVNEFELVKTIIMDKDTYYSGDEIDTNENRAYFMGAWNNLVLAYPDVSNVVLNRLMDGDLQKFMEKNNNDFDVIRNRIVEFLKIYYGLNGPVNVGSDVLSPEDLNKIKDHFNNWEEKATDSIYANDEEAIFMGAWYKFKEDYPTFANDVFNQLIKNFPNYIRDNKQNFTRMTNNILEFLENRYHPNGIDAGSPVNLKPLTVEEMIRFINEEGWYDENGPFIELDMEYDSFKDVWDRFTQRCPEMAQLILNNLMKGSLQKFVEECSGNFEIVRQRITDFIRDPNDIPIYNPNSGSAYNHVEISSDDLEIMAGILRSDDYPNPNGGMNDLSAAENSFWGAWAKFAEIYDEAAHMVFDDLMGGDFNTYIHSFNDNTFSQVRESIIRFLTKKAKGSVIINPNGGSTVTPDGGSTVNPDGESNTNPILGININDNQFYEIRRIMEDTTLYPTRPHYVITDPMLRLFGSWDALEDRFPDIARLVLKDVLGGDLCLYAKNNDLDGKDYTKTRQMIIDYIRTHYLDNKQAPRGMVDVGGKDISLCSVGEVHDYVVKQIRQSSAENDYKDFLLNQADSIFYAYLQYDDLMNRAKMPLDDMQVAAFKNKILNVLKDLSIIHTPYGGVYDDIRNILDNKGKVVKGELKKSTFIENWMEVEAKYPRIAQAVFEGIFGNSMSVFKYYLEYNGVDAVRSAICNYIEKNLLNEKYAGIPINSNILNEIISVMRDKLIPPVGYDSVTETELFYVMGSWNRLYHKYPELFKIIEREGFNGDFEAYVRNLGKGHMDEARTQVIEYARNLLNKVNTAQIIPPSNSNEYVGQFVIEQESVNRASPEQIEVMMQNAVNRAHVFTEIVKVKNPDLAADLNKMIGELYADYLLKAKSGNPQWMYVRFIKALNDLFKDLKPSDYWNSKMANMIIDKNPVQEMSSESFIEEMNNARDTAREFVNEMYKTDAPLANRLSVQIQKLYDEAMSNGDANKKAVYDDFVKKVNQAFAGSVAVFNKPRDITNIKAKDLTNSEILTRIGQTLSRKINFPPTLKIRFNELKKLDNPDRQDLLDLLRDVELLASEKSPLIKKQVRFDSIEGKSQYFSAERYNTEDFKQFKKEILNDMDIIRFALPNLFTYLDSTYGVRISEMSTLDEAQKLLSELKEYTESYLKVFSLDKSWYKLINEVYIKNTYLSNSLRNYFDTNPQELCFSKDLSKADASAIREYISNEMEILRLSNRNLYDYYLNVYFDGASSISKFFTDFERGVSAEELTSNYQEFYKTLYVDIKKQKDILIKLSSYTYNQGRFDYYTNTFGKATPINLYLKKNNSVKALLLAIVNINDYNRQTELYDKLIYGVDSVGVVNPKVIDEVKTAILRYLGVDIGVVIDDEFEVLADLMNLNLNPFMRTLLLTEYVQIINKHYESKNKDYENYVEYSMIYLEVLRYRALIVHKVIFYPEELRLLGRLTDLKAYDLINKFLESKISSKYRDVDLVSKGLVRELLHNQIVNTIEFRIHVQGMNADITGLAHINVYYEIFTSKENLPKTWSALAKKIDDDLLMLSLKDSCLYNEIRNRYFEGYSAEFYMKHLDVLEEAKYPHIEKAYLAIYNLLNYYKSNDLLYLIEKNY